MSNQSRGWTLWLVLADAHSAHIACSKIAAHTFCSKVAATHLHHRTHVSLPKLMHVHVSLPKLMHIHVSLPQLMPIHVSLPKLMPIPCAGKEV